MKKDIILLLLGWIILGVVVFAVFGCNPMKPYNKVYADSANRSKDKVEVLSKVCSAQFPQKVVEGTLRIDTLYIANPFLASECDTLIDSLNTIISHFTPGTINVDSVRAELLKHIKTPVIYKYKTDTVLDIAAIAKANFEKNEAICNEQLAKAQLLKSEKDYNDFLIKKGSTWYCFKWFVASLPFWVWIILALFLGGTVLVKLLRSNIIKFV